MSFLPALRSAGALALAGVAVALFAAAGACSFLVSDTPPGLACQPDGSATPICPLDQVCAPVGGGAFRCAAPCSPSTCLGGSCDSASGLCIASPGEDGGSSSDVGENPSDAGAPRDSAPPRGDGSTCDTFGCPCETVADCASGFTCVDRAAATSAVWAGLGDAAPPAGGICMEPCCTSSDCDSTPTDGGAIDWTVCFATGAGGNYCVPPAWLGDRGDLAMSKPGGSPCGGDAGGCRSGLCVGGSCADTCCDTKSSSECATSGDFCRFGPFPGAGFDTHVTANCTAPTSVGMNLGGAGCNGNGDCRSNLCLNQSTFGQGRCADACRNRDDCQPGVTTRSQTCSYFQMAGDGGTDVVAACMPLVGPAGSGDAGGDGTACRTSSDCAKGYCALQAGSQVGQCIAVCFFDSDMSSGDCPTTERCRPQAVLVGNATYSVLACGS